MSSHETVLPQEAVDALHVKSHGLYVDATLGGGGHTIEILKRGGKVIGIEADKSILEIAKKNIEAACPPQRAGALNLVNGNFKDIDSIVDNTKNTSVDGVLYDLGVSNFHFLDKQRGFSFRNKAAKLDMRLDQDSESPTAAALLNLLRKDQLFELFLSTMDYKLAKKYSNLIASYRHTAKIDTVGDFLDALRIDNSNSKSTHPATTAFLALRVVVNNELENTSISLGKALKILVPSGRIAAITFHSGEDKIVKDLFKDFEAKDLGKVITKKPILPSNNEIKKNKKSRSAKLRVFQKKGYDYPPHDDWNTHPK
jgi:16S rRNA (cytosine1402-N4)-methyltransferase